MIKTGWWLYLENYTEFGITTQDYALIFTSLLTRPQMNGEIKWNIWVEFEREFEHLLGRLSWLHMCRVSRRQISHFTRDILSFIKSGNFNFSTRMFLRYLQKLDSVVPHTIVCQHRTPNAWVLHPQFKLEKIIMLYVSSIRISGALQTIEPRDLDLAPNNRTTWLRSCAKQ